jgi:hypothetical protein
MMSENKNDERRTVNIMPTSEGFEAMARIFRETVAQSEQKIAQVEEFQRKYENWQENFSEFADAPDTVVQLLCQELLFDYRALLSDALDALEDQERSRIASIQEGIEGLAKRGY